MKPDWRDAPEWANWLAMDEDGSWWWYEEEPTVDNASDDYFTHNGGYAEIVKLKMWKETKEKRP